MATNFGYDGDLKLDPGTLDFSMVSGADYLPIRIRQRLRAFQGEWWLNPSLGLPYHESILGQKQPDLDSIRGIFIDAILGVTGVESLTSLTVGFDNATRTYTVSFEATGTDGTTVEESIDL